MQEYIKHLSVVDSKAYKPFMARNVYVIGGLASKDLEKFPDNTTKFVGKDFKETIELIIKYLKERKLYN
ncbi:hypothetical protein [Metaclostridioides mangenotii]|uniref:hypothetical protein n=1 Tax=Metaclostridioides mangenotii TaxID=1540 RepID=UPI00048A3C74|nr:hypothetical protein [Clostridioides mangenotii]